MLKIAGLILLIGSGAGIGYSKCRELTAGLRAQEMLLRMVILLKGEIRFGNTGLSDAMTGAGERLSGVYGAFMCQVAEEIKQRNTEAFRDIFRRNAERYFGKTGLSKEEQEQLVSLGEHLGYLDLDMQIKQLELYEREVEESIRVRKSELPEKKKVYLSLGIFFGFFLAVMMF